MKTEKLRPMSVAQSAWYFVVSSFLIYFGLYFGIPFLLKKDIPFVIGYLVLFYFPFALMFFTALILYHREKNDRIISTFQQRMRLNPLKKSDCLWIIGIILFYLLLAALLTPVMNSLAKLSFFSPPDFFPAEINPNKGSTNGYMMDYRLSGQYWLPIVYFIGWFFNIFGEEFLWRGIILPRQIKKYGKKAWIIHGLMWGAWHFFWKWQLVMLFPFALFFTYVIYKSQNTWVGIISHGALNAIPLILIIINVFQ